MTGACVAPKRLYTDKNNAFVNPVKEFLEAKNGILPIRVTPVERSHVSIKRRYSVIRPDVTVSIF